MISIELREQNFHAILKLSEMKRDFTRAISMIETDEELNLLEEEEKVPDTF